MRYDFETLVRRENAGSFKWNDMKIKNPDVKENVVPLSVADMEWKNPPEAKFFYPSDSFFVVPYTDFFVITC